MVANYDYDFDAAGNITNKSDYATNFTYNTYRHQGGNAGPNAVRRITRGNNNYHFTYDNNGNMLTGNGLTQAIYNSDNKPTSLVKNNATTQFSYGADGMRFKQTKTTGGQTTTTYYVGKGFEREVQPGNNVLDKTFIDNHTTLYKVFSGTPDYAAPVLHNLVDRLGSPSTLIKGGSDAPIVIRHRAHGVFGRPIDAGTGSALDSLGQWDGQYRGYTGHEQLVEQQLVHMNGRVYDYNLGRFLSVDPFVHLQGGSQGINPYSYIMNNPMAGTDPSGYLPIMPIIIWGINAYAAYETANDAVDTYDSYQNGDMEASDVAAAMASSAIENTVGKKLKVAKAGLDKIRQAAKGKTPNADAPDAKSQNASKTNGGSKGNGSENSQSASGSKPESTTEIGSPSQTSKKDQLEQNKAQGKAGEAKVREELGDSNRGEQVTVETLDGDRARLDFVTMKDGKPNLLEVKTWDARLSRGQRAVKGAIDRGEPVIPRGANAEKASLPVGEKVSCSFEEKRC